MRLLIAIITCLRYAERADAVRQTWARDVQQWADVRFFVGDPSLEESVIDGDCVFLPVSDDYTGLPAKVQAVCRWAKQNGYDFVFKTDDDVYVNPKIFLQLIQHLHPHHYVGRFRGPSGGYPADYASGFGYFLSNHAMGLVADAKPTKDWAEDRFVGNVLAHHKIFGWAYDNNYFAPVAPPLKPEVIFRSNIKSAAVFCEFPNPVDIFTMHRYCRQTQIVPSPLIAKAVPPLAVSMTQLHANPTDKPATRQTVQHMDDQQNNFQRALVAAAQEKGGALTPQEREQVRQDCLKPQPPPMKDCPCCGGTGRILA